MLNTMVFGSSDFCSMSEVNVCVCVCVYTWFFQAKGFAKKTVKDFFSGKLSGGMGKNNLYSTNNCNCSLPALRFLGVLQ